MVKQPCEIIVNYILPSVRAQLSKELVQLGNSQRKVSKILEITPAAVSQYISGKRGYALNFDDDSLDILKKMAKEIHGNGDVDIGKEVCNVCSHLWNEFTFEQLEKQFEGITDGCGECVGRV